MGKKDDKLVLGGHEFTSFVLGLYNAAGPGQALEEGCEGGHPAAGPHAGAGAASAGVSGFGPMRRAPRSLVQAPGITFLSQRKQGDSSLRPWSRTRSSRDR